MTEKQFYRVVEIYGCHVTRETCNSQTVLTVSSPTYSEKREMELGDIFYAQDSEITAMLTKLSGKRLADFWTGQERTS